MIKFDYNQFPFWDNTSVRMVVTVPRTLAAFIRWRAFNKGLRPGVFAAQLLEDAFVTLAEEEMLELRLDPKTLSPILLHEAYRGNYRNVNQDELSAMMGLSPAFLADQAEVGTIPGQDFTHRGTYWFLRDVVVPWLLSDEAKQLYDANPQHHLPRP